METERRSDISDYRGAQGQDEYGSQTTAIETDSSAEGAF